MLLEIRYCTEYRYEPAVTGGLTVLRLRPVDRPGLEVLSANVVSHPGGVRRSYIDAWGSAVDLVEFERFHEQANFEIVARVRTNVVEEDDLPPNPFELYAFCHESERTPFAPLGPLGWDVDSEGASWISVESLLHWFPQRFSYQLGATDAKTPIAQVIALGAGVCQDFAHVMLAMLRRWGWPARYVSGYFFSASNSVQQIEAEAMHAWVEVYRQGAGWIGLDATTGNYTDERYVPVGYGRDYGDVAPIRGVLHGQSTQVTRSQLQIHQIPPIRLQQQ